MKKMNLILLFLMIASLSSCQLIGDIFEAGVWTGILLVVGVVVLIFFLIAKLFGRGK